MVTAAPRIDPLLLKALRRLDSPTRSIADTHRRLGEIADRLDMTRPSYQAVRLHVHDQRARATEPPSVTGLLLDVAFRSKPPEALLDILE